MVDGSSPLCAHSRVHEARATGGEMFERFPEPSRRALFFSRALAELAGCDSILPEHLVGGVLRAAPTAVADDPARASTCDGLLRDLRFDRFAATWRAPTREIPLSRDVQRLLNEATAEADRMGHHLIRPQHLLLALLKESGTPAAEALRRAGVQRAWLNASAVEAAAIDDQPLSDVTVARRVITRVSK
jgi:ATP-dependent Clp protease ATP-binding subunit ClpC